ncbi:MAG TPA: phosphohistidine phosphatase SixA [Gaiellaceae bacterium]|nr:phosphohistidine phosphatase SixA [Gaiellaceae bacterium]
MRVYLVRHAEAAPGQPDELRPLTPAGRESARRLGERLAGEARVDAVLTSPLLRARETAEAIAKAAGVTAEPTDLLAPGAGDAELLAAVDGRGAVVVCVGHQPDCGRIAAALAGGAEPPFPPGGIARLDLAV